MFAFSFLFSPQENLMYQNSSSIKIHQPFQSKYPPRTGQSFSKFNSRYPKIKPCILHKVVCQDSNKDPKSLNGWNLSQDKNYVEVRVLSVGAYDDLSGGTNLTLRPVVTDAPLALKMCVTNSQADSIRNAAAGSAVKNSRPTSHELFQGIIESQNLIVTKVAITHIHKEVYYARIWVRGHESGEVSLDSRPSDAIVLATRNCAPIYLNKGLLEKWGFPVKIALSEIKNSFAEVVTYAPTRKSTSSLILEKQKKVEDIEVAKLRMELDLAVRLQRFTEAASIQDEINKICPIDTLKADLEKAIIEQRFMDAAKIRDQIYHWKIRMKAWDS